MIKAFDKIIKKSNWIPKYVSSDRDKEFVNKDFKVCLENNNVEQRLIHDFKVESIHSWNQQNILTKYAAMVFNKEIKLKMKSLLKMSFTQLWIEYI